MRIILVILGVCLLGMVSCQQEALSPQQPAGESGSAVVMEEEYYPGMLNVKFRREVADSLQTMIREGKRHIGKEVKTKAITGLQEHLGDARIVPLFKEGGKFAGQRRKFGLDRWFRLEFDPSLDIREITGIATRGGFTGAIEHLEPVYRIVFNKGKKVDGDVYRLLRTPFQAAVATMPFNDPRLNEQWHYDRGIIEAVPESGIGLFSAWKKTVGSPEVIVAVLDEGIDYNHEDLNANMWVNAAEREGEEGVDDDGNGYRDDIHGYNFSRDKSAIDPMDHGTHIAGTISAVNNNAKGVCGIAGGSGNNDGVKVMCCQITAKGLGMNGVEDAFAYAAENGAVICSCSWYVVRTGESIKEAIDYFNEVAGSQPGSPMKGGVVFFAAGNDNRQSKIYPPAWENVLAVASLNTQNRRSYFSNYADWVDLAAPGGGNDTEVEKNILSTLPNNSYGYMMGTSMACPHVSGIAALTISSHIGEADFTSSRLKEILLNAVTDLSSMDADASLLGKGLLRADLAVGADEGRNIVPGLPAEVKLNSRLGVTLKWKVQADALGQLPVTYLVYAGKDAADRQKAYATVLAEGYAEGDTISCLLKPFSSNGEYHITVAARNQWGKLAESPEAIRFGWNNDYRAPETVKEARVTAEGAHYVVHWSQVADVNDEVAVAYNISCRDERLKLWIDTTLWVGKQPLGQELTFDVELPGAAGMLNFVITPIDEWNNWGKESAPFNAVGGGSVDRAEVYGFPNPVEKEMTVVWDDKFKGEKLIAIYDVAGRLIYKMKIGAGEKNGRLDLSSFAAGWYIVRFEADGQKKEFTILKK